ncbi:hypothetical protein IAQ61_010283 [Plenodomus lingam]|uniref:uncharacterized protein n=1 Tax=Leptosphaeria maculans TaxID=5022 RepID=UPI0033314D37|nr:hypothetical protein IAQ61_010283 [Plenodomus lingam]
MARCWRMVSRDRPARGCLVGKRSVSKRTTLRKHGTSNKEALAIAVPTPRTAQPPANTTFSGTSIEGVINYPTISNPAPPVLIKLP